MSVLSIICYTIICISFIFFIVLGFIGLSKGVYRK